MSDDTTVIVVHGLWMTGVESFLMRRHLQTQTDWSVVSFSYASVRGSLEDIVARLARFVDKQTTETVHLVAHSLGGIVVHELAHTVGFNRGGRAVLLCSPIQGSQVAARLAKVPLGKRMLGGTVCKTLIRPARRIWQANTEVGVLAGTRGMGLGRLVGGFQGPNDGTVSLAETELPGATDSVALSVSHTSALFSTAVAAQIVFFLSHGRFRRPA